MEKLEQYYAILTPKFSTYTDMPIALQIYSTFKNRWCGAFWQKHGKRVISTIAWGTPASYDFCFDGVEQNSVVAVSTYCMENYKSEFMPGYIKIEYDIILQPFDEKSNSFLPVNKNTNKRYFLKRNNKPNILTPRIWLKLKEIL